LYSIVIVSIVMSSDRRSGGRIGDAARGGFVAEVVGLQESDDRDVLGLACIGQRCTSPAVRGPGLRSVVQQEAHRRGMPLSGGKVEAVRPS
jgi:hypothetical protein